jgi:quinoprotein dehydrogenase-associated probable ABC transporter substrate-binding protein
MLRLTTAAAGLMAAVAWAGAAAAATASTGAADANGKTLRVCADPNNMPFSDKGGHGFENKLAELVAHELGETVSYTWFAQRRGFVRNTLKARKCDVVMGMPIGDHMVETTRPYYRSTYVFVTRADRHLDISSMTDPRLRKLRVGVEMIGDDGANTPPAHALSTEGIITNVSGYMIYGDYRQPAPPSRIVRDVAAGKIDIAAPWGPMAGYFAKQSSVPLVVTPITHTAQFAPAAFQYDIAMAVRKHDDALRDRLNQIIVRQRSAIHALLVRYGVPLVEGEGASTAQTKDSPH